MAFFLVVKVLAMLVGIMTASVDGIKCAISAITATKDDNELGRLDIKLLNKETHIGIFFKYTYVEDSNPDDVIVKIKLTGRDSSEIEAVLTSIRSSIQDVLFKSTDNSFSEKLAMSAIVGMCIQPEAKVILIPSSSGIEVTNSIISNFVNNEWIGIEVKIPSDVKENFLNLTGAKEKVQQDYSQMFRAAMKNAMNNEESSHTEQ